MKTVHPHEAGVELLVEQHLSKEGAKKDIVFAVFSSHGIALEIDQRGPTVRIYVHSRYGGQWHREHAMFAIKGPHAAAPSAWKVSARSCSCRPTRGPCRESMI